MRFWHLTAVSGSAGVHLVAGRIRPLQQPHRIGEPLWRSSHVAWAKKTLSLLTPAPPLPGNRQGAHVSICAEGALVGQMEVT